MQIPNFTFPEASGVDLDDMLNLFSLPLRNHSRRVAICASIMAGYAQEFLQARYINVDPAFAATVHLGATCHDLGKLMLPALIVDKADYMRHPAAGGELLELIKKEAPDKLDSIDFDAKPSGWLDRVGKKASSLLDAASSALKKLPKPNN